MARSADQIEAGRSVTPELKQFFEAVRQRVLHYFGVDCALVDFRASEPIVLESFASGFSPPFGWLSGLSQRRMAGRSVFVEPLADPFEMLVLPLPAPAQDFAALVPFASRPVQERDWIEAGEAFASPDWPSDSIPFGQREFMVRVGVAALESVAQDKQLEDRTEEIRMMASQVARNYEEITLLYQLTREAQVSQGTRTVQELALSLLADVLAARQLVHVDSRSGDVLSEGERVLTAAQCRDLVEQLKTTSPDRPLVENHVPSLDWSEDYPGLCRLILVPVAKSGDQFGWLLAINSRDGSELGSIEASLMVAVAAILGTHEMHVKLFQNIEDLFLGVVRVLSSAIDAKDPYTCGHSDRVARIASRIGEQLGLPEEEIKLLYLSGLLHDVGKIGIRDQVLLKPGRLSDEEFEHIKQHVTIGYDILSRVTQLQPILPGVRNHHEHYDGTGYPDRLQGGDIPLMARILAVADAFDAMSSNRPYRQGMDIGQIETIFRAGAGRQWDSRVVEAFLAVRPEIEQMCQQDTSPAEAEGIKDDAYIDQKGLRKISKLLALGLR